MTSIPPLLPEEILARVIRLARSNGLSILLVAALAAILEATQHDVFGAIIGLLAAGAGAMEIHGTSLLRWGDRRGMRWLIQAELFLLAVILGYCAIRLTIVDLTEIRAAFHAGLEFPSMREKWAEAQQMGLTEGEYLHAVYQLTYLLLSIATLLYQGGMTIYYLRRRNAVARALEIEM
jgi:hypothetical protein